MCDTLFQVRYGLNWTKWDEQKPENGDSFDIITMPTKAKGIVRFDAFRVTDCGMRDGKCMWFTYEVGTDNITFVKDWETEKGPILYWRARDIPDGLNVPDMHK